MSVYTYVIADDPRTIERKRKRFRMTARSGGFSVANIAVSRLTQILASVDTKYPSESELGAKKKHPTKS